MKIIISIPAYNEEATLGDVIYNVHNIMKTMSYIYEIIVLNDGSTDGTSSVAREHDALVYSHHRNFGLAETFRSEIKFTLENDADVIVHIDADGQYRAEDIPKLIGPIMEGEADLVLGSRFMGTIEEMPIVKKLGNRAFSKVVSQISGLKITDSQTGFRVFTKEVAETVKVTSTYTYTQEQIIKSAENKFRIKEVPIYFAKRHKGESRLMSNPLEFAFKAGINLIRIYRDFVPLKFFGLVGASLIGIAFMTYIYSSIVLNQIMDISILTLFLSGVQIILFGFLAEMVKK